MQVKTSQGTEYTFKPDSLYRVKAQLNETFCKRFFSPVNKQFFGDQKYYWSKSRQVLIITQKRFDQVVKTEYKLSGEILGDLTLVLVKKD